MRVGGWRPRARGGERGAGVPRRPSARVQPRQRPQQRGPRADGARAQGWVSGRRPHGKPSPARAAPPGPLGTGWGERIRRASQTRARDANTRRHPSAAPRRFCACPPRPRRRPRLVEPGSRGGALAAGAAGKRRSGAARPRGATPAWPLEVDAPQPPGCDDLGGGRAGSRAPDGAEPAGDGCERGSRGPQSGPALTGAFLCGRRRASVPRTRRGQTLRRADSGGTGPWPAQHGGPLGVHGGPRVRRQMSHRVRVRHSRTPRGPGASDCGEKPAVGSVRNPGPLAVRR